MNELLLAFLVGVMVGLLLAKMVHYWVYER